MLKSLKNNESGMAMIMVIMAVVIMMVFSVGVVSRTASQARSAEGQVDRIRVEQLGIGYYAREFSRRAAGNAGNTMLTYSATLDNRTYYVNLVDDGPVGPNNTNRLTVTAPF